MVPALNLHEALRANLHSARHHPMRFRLITRPPLPPVKAWFSIADGVQRTQTVSSLKHDICSRIPALEADLVSADDIQLSVDDFDLLDSAEVGIIREDDLVW